MGIRWRHEKEQNAMRRLMVKVMQNATGHWAIFYAIGVGLPKMAYHKIFKTKDMAEKWARKFIDRTHEGYKPQRIDVRALLDN